MEGTGFVVYGDNFDECQEFCALVSRVSRNFGISYLGRLGPIDKPIYTFRIDDKKDSVFGLYPCGRYEDWSPERRPYIGHEDPDIMLCRVEDSRINLSPIFAAEFNDAIPAGNNAWQRYPRIAQSAAKSIPFLYVVSTCDAEVKDGVIHSIRHPNCTIQIAQLVLMNRYSTPSLTAFIESPWYWDGLKSGKALRSLNGEHGERIIGGFAIARILESMSFGSIARPIAEECFHLAVSDMLEHIDGFCESDFAILKNHSAFARGNREPVANAFLKRVYKKGTISKDLAFWRWNMAQIADAGIPFGKATSTPSTYSERLNPKMQLKANASLRDLTEFCSNWSIECDKAESRAKTVEVVTASKKNRPLSYKYPPNELAIIFNLRDLSALLKRTYPGLENNITERILRMDPPIVFLPIAGYVMDTGGAAFSRPDKGLVGLVETLFGEGAGFGGHVVLLYSELVPKEWRQGLSAAVKSLGSRKELGSNNLWRELAAFADVVICDIHNNGVEL